MGSIDTYTAFDGNKLIFQGSLTDVVLKIKKRLGKEGNSSILIFSNSTGNVVDFNFHGHDLVTGNGWRHRLVAPPQLYVT